MRRWSKHGEKAWIRSGWRCWTWIPALWLHSTADTLNNLWHSPKSSCLQFPLHNLQMNTGHLPHKNVWARLTRFRWESSLPMSQRGWLLIWGYTATSWGHRLLPKPWHQRGRGSQSSSESRKQTLETERMGEAYLSQAFIQWRLTVYPVHTYR